MTEASWESKLREIMLTWKPVGENPGIFGGVYWHFISPHKPYLASVDVSCMTLVMVINRETHAILYRSNEIQRAEAVTGLHLATLLVKERRNGVC